MKKRNRKKLTAALAVLALIALLGAGLYVRAARAEERAESTTAVQETIERLALQCYVIEGAYPEGLDYLVENYGLAVNREDYKIVYTPVAENLPPDVRVIERNGK